MRVLLIFVFRQWEYDKFDADTGQSELNAPQDVITCAQPSTAPHDQSSLPQCLDMDTLQIGVVNSILTIGGLIGALVSGTIAAQYGRQPALLYNAAFLIIGPILEAAAPAVWVLALGRFISGIGVGTSTVVTPLFISEIAIPKFKGFFGSFTQTSINAGILLAQVLGYFLSKGQLWRVILGTGGIVGVLHFVLLFFMNESPKWLAENGRAAQGKQVLRKLRGHKADIIKEVNGWNLGDAEEREGCQQVKHVLSSALLITLQTKNKPFSKTRTAAIPTLPPQQPQRTLANPLSASSLSSPTPATTAASLPSWS